MVQVDTRPETTIYYWWSNDYSRVKKFISFLVDEHVEFRVENRFNHWLVSIPRPVEHLELKK